MGIDFTKQLKKKIKKLSENPIEIYEDLDRSASVGPLRPVQVNILTEWYKNRKDNKELIIKLPTGAGKTLIGLLILKSKLNAGFDDEYGTQVLVRRFIVSPTHKISYESNFTHDVQIIRKGKLEQLKRNILGFIRELAQYNFSELHIDTLDQLLVTHNLKTDNFSEIYSEEYKK